MWKIAVLLIVFGGVVLLVRNFLFKKRQPAVREVTYICDECGEKHCSCKKHREADGHQ